MDDFNQNQNQNSNGQVPFQNNDLEYQRPYPESNNQQIPPQNTYSPEANYQQPYYQGEMNNPEPPKKSHKKSIALVIALVLVLSVGGVAFAFRDTIKNAIALATKSPKEYYIDIEKEALNKSLDDYAKKYSAYNRDSAYKLSTDISFDRDTLSSLLQTAAGLSLEDFESTYGIKLDKINTDITVAQKDMVSNFTINLGMNDTDLITAEMFMDLANKQILMRIPELSSAYLREPIEMDTEATFDYNKLLEWSKKIDANTITELVKRYSDSYFDNIDDVKINKNQELSVDEMKQGCTEVVVTIDQDATKNILLDLLKEAKDDKFILDMLNVLNVSESEYKDGIDEAISEIESDPDSYFEGFTDIVMTVYVDDKGNILGRKLDIDTISLGGYTINDGSKYESKFFISDSSSKSDLISLEAKYEKKNDSYTGKCNVEISPESTDMASGVSFNVDFENVKTEQKDGRTFVYGDITIGSAVMMGAEIKLNLDVKDGVQSCKTVFEFGSAPVVTLDTTVELLKDYEIKMPSGSDQIYDSETYSQNIDVEKFISDLSDKLGVDLNSLLGNTTY